MTSYLTPWITTKVITGDQVGRKINYPTINLNPEVIPDNIKKGVYASSVIISNYKIKDGIQKEFVGALYFGPKFINKNRQEILEIFLMDFDQDVYGKSVSFRLVSFIRPPLEFSSLDEMKKQIQDDVKQIRLKIKKT